MIRGVGNDRDRHFFSSIGVDLDLGGFVEREYWLVGIPLFTEVLQVDLRVDNGMLDRTVKDVSINVATLELLKDFKEEVA